MNKQLKLEVELFQKLKAFLDSENYSFYKFLSQRRLVMLLFRANYFDLLKSYSLHNNHQINDRLWNQVSFRYRQRVQVNLVRLISNYLASLSSIIDFTRANILPYFKTNAPVYHKYEELKKDYLATNQSHKFVQDLRNFTIHNSALSISSEIAHNSLGVRVSIFIKKRDILIWSGWSSESLLFINNQEEKIYLIEILHSHFEKFLEFQNATYLLMFLVDTDKVALFQSELNTAYNQICSHSDRMQPLTKGYIKYLKLMIGKAKRTYDFAHIGQITLI